MGSWNATCGISNLPIRYRDPVKLLVIQNGHYKGFHECGGMYCYSDDLFQPVGVALEGNYADYGMPEEFNDTPGSRWLHQELLRRYTKGSPWGRVALSDRVLEDDLPKDITTASLTELIRAIERGGVWKEDAQRDPKNPEKIVINNEPYSLFMIHTCIWNQILAHLKEPATKARGWRVQDYEECQKEVRQFLSEFVPPTEDPKPATRDATWNLRDKYEKVVGYKSAIHWYELTEMLPDRREEALWLFDHLAETKQIISFMCTIRRGLFPQFGGGSQGVDYEDHTALASWIQHYCDNRQDAQDLDWKQSIEEEGFVASYRRRYSPPDEGGPDCRIEFEEWWKEHYDAPLPVAIEIERAVLGELPRQIPLTSFQDHQKLAKWLKLSRELGIIK